MSRSRFTRPLILFVFVTLLLTGPAPAVVIDFDALGDRVVVTNQFPDATFSSDPGFECKTAAQNLGTSLPNFICTAAINGSITCANSVIVDFTAPANNLTFLATGADSAGVKAKVDVYENALYSATVDIVTDGNPSLPDLIDLSGFTNVTKIVVHSVTDRDGLGWDDFTFETTPLPVEPSTWGKIKALYQ